MLPFFRVGIYEIIRQVSSLQKEGRQYLPQEAPSRACKNELRETKEKGNSTTQDGPTNKGHPPSCKQGISFLKNGNFKLRKDKIADPVIRQLNVTFWLFEKGKKDETFEIYFV